MASVPTIVLDSGAYRTRVGISGQDVPEETFRTVLGRKRKGSQSAGGDETDVFIGEDAQEDRANLDLTYPLDKYTINNMEDMGRIWSFCCMDVLGCDSLEDCPIMITDGPVDAVQKVKSRAKLAEILFEKYMVPSFYVAMQPFLALISLEKTTGLVVDVGESMASTVPVVDGAVVQEGIVTTDIVSGRQITDLLMKLLNEREGVSIADRETVIAIKEKLGYFAYDYEGEFKWAGSTVKDFTLPDGQVISVGTERFQCTEPLFRPSLLGTDSPIGGIHQMVHQSIERCDESTRPALYDAILISGGSTLIPNMTHRLKMGVKELAGTGTEVRVLAPPTRAWAAWLGGSLLAEWDGFTEMSVRKDEYQESGAEIVNKKCKN